MYISVKAATILAIILEGILYGISTFLFAITLWALIYRRKSTKVYRPMVAAACLLFLMGTMHVIFDAYHVWQGFISAEDAEQFFGDYSKITFKNALNEAETLFGDAILIYRCYVVWQRRDIIIVPIIGWMAVAVTGTHTVWSLSQLTPTNTNVVSQKEATAWVISFYVIALVTNLITTGILALKLWLVHQRSSKFLATGSPIYPILRIIVESGGLYSMSLVTMLAAYPTAFNSAYILVDMIAQIIPITFFLIIVRTTMLRFNSETGQWLSTCIETSHHLSVARPVTVHISHTTTVDFDVSETSENSHAHIEDIYHSKVDSYANSDPESLSPSK